MDSRSLKNIFPVVIAVLAAGLGIVWIQLDSRQQIAPAARNATGANSPDDGPKRNFPPIVLDIPGVDDPYLVPAVESDLKDEDLVIGVAAFGESRAYLRRAFDGPLGRRIVNDKFGSVPVSITHCNRTGCTRVLTGDKRQGPFDIRCGGWLASQEMSLLIENRSYAQSSREIPWTDIPFVITTWKDWMSAQPQTLVYLGREQRRQRPRNDSAQSTT